MEKSFNDDELADIMNEIESLEKEFTEESEAQVSAPQQEEISESEEFEEEIFDSKPTLDDIDPLEAHSDDDSQVVREVAPTLDAEKQVLKKVVSKPVDEVVHLSSAPQKSHSMPTHHSAVHGDPAHTSMSFNVEGDMRLSLSFNVAGKTVQLCVNDQGLELEMDGGIKFSVPLDIEHKGEKAA